MNNIYTVPPLKTGSNAYISLPLKIAICIFLISFCFSVVSSIVIVDPDIWHEMALIREAIALGHIPLEDRFAYTPTIFPSVHNEWGAGVIAYFVSAWFGGAGIVVVKYLVTGITAFFLLLCLRKKLVSIETLSFLLPIGITLLWLGFSNIRAQMYSYAFVACLLWFFELDRNKNRIWIAAWIPLYLIWLNVHGGFLVGIGLLGAYWLEQVLRRKPHVHLIIVGIIMALLIWVNPYGFSYYQYLLNAITMPYPYIEEWKPIWEGLPLFFILIFLLSLVFLIYSVRQIGLRNANGLALIFVTGIATILCMRFIFFYAIVWTCYVPGYIQRTPLADTIRDFFIRFQKYFLLFFCFVTICFFYRTISSNPFKLIVPGNSCPLGPVEYLSGVSFRGNLMVHYNWGSYVSWKLYPNVRVSMDSRYEVAYPEWMVDESFEFYNAGNNWKRILTSHPTDLVLVNKKLPVAKVMPTSGWKKVYNDRIFEMYARPGLKLPVVDRADRIPVGSFP